MFESLVVTLREGTEAALIVAIVLGYLKKIDRPSLARSAYLGIAAAVAASIGGAVALARFQFDEDRFEGWGMLIASVFVASMVVWMWRTSSRIKGDIETRLGRAAQSAPSGFSPGIFLFVFLMIAREGMETVLFLGAVRFNTTAMLNFLGGIIGLALAVIFGVLFVKGSIRINLRKFFQVTSVILLVVAAQLFISGLHELSESLVLPSSEREMAIIGPIVKNQAVFYVLILVLTALMLFWQRQKAGPLSADANPAERRKALHLARRERLWARGLATLALASVVMITAQFVYSASSTPDPVPEKAFEAGQEVRVPVASVADGKLHLFAYKAATQTVRFIIMKIDGTRFGVALDACQICGDKGYFQDGQQIVCKNCTAAINPDSIGQGGGCNPVALPSKTQGSDIVIESADLDSAAAFFHGGAH